MQANKLRIPPLKANTPKKKIAYQDTAIIDQKNSGYRPQRLTNSKISYLDTVLKGQQVQDTALKGQQIIKYRIWIAPSKANNVRISPSKAGKFRILPSKANKS